MYKIGTLFVIFACGVLARPKLEDLTIEKIEDASGTKFIYTNPIRTALGGEVEYEYVATFGNKSQDDELIHSLYINSPGASEGVTEVELHSEGDAMRNYISCDVKVITSPQSWVIIDITVYLPSKNVTVFLESNNAENLSLLCAFYGTRVQLV